MADYISKQRAKDLMGCCLASAKAEYKSAKDEFTKARFEDYISTIQAMINVVGSVEAADVQPVDRWISVDERLPKTGESVLVYVAINKNLKGFGECKPEIRIGWLDDGGKWALQFSNMDYSEVLCWLPLPEPPKDGDTE